MKPLLLAAFYCGLGPIGDPPLYKPSWKAVLYGAVLGAAIVTFFGYLMYLEIVLVYDEEDVLSRAHANSTSAEDLLEDLLEDALEDVLANAPKVALEASANTTIVPGTRPVSTVSRALSRVITVCSAIALLIAYVGLYIGYFKKLKHLPRVFQMSDDLPGKAHWKTALFIAELSVLSTPISAHAVKAYYESRGLSHVDAYAMLGMLYCIEKFMILHLVTRVGTGFDDINRRLEAVGSAGNQTPSVCDTLRLLRQQHMDMCELLQLIVRSYEVQVLTFIVSEFVLSVLALYIQARNVYQDRIYWMDLLSLFFMTLVTQITSLTYGTCQQTSAKGNTTATLVHKLLNTRRFTDEDVQQFLIFSLQTSHSKVSFSPYDVVTLDYSLLHATMSSVLMYIIILVQFNLSGSTS